MSLTYITGPPTMDAHILMYSHLLHFICIILNCLIYFEGDENRITLRNVSVRRNETVCWKWYWNKWPTI